MLEGEFKFAPGGVKLTLFAVGRHLSSARPDQAKNGNANKSDCYDERNQSDYERKGRDHARGRSGDRRGRHQHHCGHDEPDTSSCLHPDVSHLKEKSNASADGETIAFEASPRIRAEVHMPLL